MRTFLYLKAILACVILQLEKEGHPAGCSQLILPGTRPFVIGMGDTTDVGDGQVWVRLSSAVESVDVGQANADPRACGSMLGFTIEVGVMRCFIHPDWGDELDPAEVEASAMRQLEDMESIRTALLCCDALEGGDWLLGAYTPIGPEGPDVGGAWTLTAAPLNLPVVPEVEVEEP